MNDDAYRRPELWLSDGWDTVTRLGWRAPQYWEKSPSGEWTYFTLSGQRAIDLNEPVCHVSYYEADAFARWSGARLATEAEWEHAASSLPVAGNFAEIAASIRFLLRAMRNCCKCSETFGLGPEALIWHIRVSVPPQAQ